MAAIFLGLAALMFFWEPGPNCWIGVRLPWTFADLEIWTKSWRLAARLLVLLGIGALWSWRAFYCTLALFIALSLGHPIYLYRRKYGTLRLWKDHGWIAYHPVARCGHCGHYQKLPDAAALPLARCEGCGQAFLQG